MARSRCLINANTVGVVRRLGAALALSLLIWVPSSAEGQTACGAENEYMEVVRSQSLAAGVVLVAEGYELVEVICGALDEGKDEFLTTSIGDGRSGAYVAVCDQDCSDIDLALYSGTLLLAEDIETDDFPIIEYTSTRGAEDLTLEISMYRCSVEPCFYAVTMYTAD